MKRVLIITSESERYYYQPFLNAARGTDLEILVFDTQRYPSDCHCSIAMAKDGQITGDLDVVRYVSAEREGELTNVPLHSIEVAWHLRAREPIPKLLTPGLEVKYASNESQLALEAVWRVAPWRWINKKWVVKGIEFNKLYQQQLAAQAGLNVPDTLTSNQAAHVLGHVEKEGQLLLKSHGYPEFNTREDLFIYSNLFSREELVASYQAIQECPVFAQMYVPKKYEYRVMAIGKQVLACRIDSQASDKTRIDWRHYDFENVAHTSVSLPAHINDAILRFMSRIDLNYGAIDLIETPDGDFVFLEVNPSGQWEWISRLGGVPVATTVVQMLKVA